MLTPHSIKMNFSDLIKKENQFLIFIITLVSAVTLPFIFTDGMFLDGLLYSAIGKKMAIGQGSFWFPQLSLTYESSFHEHPPLAFGILSVFYKIFGTDFWVERFFNLIVFTITFKYIYSLIIFITNDKQRASRIFSFFLLLFFLIPKNHWAIQHVMLDNVLSMFSLISLFHILKFTVKDKYLWIHITLAVLTTCCALLTKGLPGLFPLFCPILYCLYNRKIPIISGVKSSTLLTVLFFTVITALLYLNEDAYSSLKTYFDQQLLASLKGDRVIVDSRFHIMKRILEEILVVIIATSICGFILYRKKKNNSNYLKTALFFFIIGCSASIPIMLSPKQLDFYMIPSLPYFTLAASFICSQLFFDKNLCFRGIKYISTSVFILCIILTAFFWGKPKRDQQIINDTKSLNVAFPESTIFSCTNRMHSSWNIFSYFSRYSNLNVDRSEERRKYILLFKDEEIPLQYTLVDLPLSVFKIALQKKIKPQHRLKPMENNSKVD